VKGLRGSKTQIPVIDSSSPKMQMHCHRNYTVHNKSTQYSSTKT